MLNVKCNALALSSGQNTDNVIIEFKPDVIILDIFLGCEDRRDICKEIKQKHKAIPVILVSVSMGLKEHSIACGAHDFVSKPFDIDYLLSKVNDWAKKYQQLKTDSTT
ncbi:response regulator [Ferruginibacter sp.]|uniref:response regulator n=1 Tax=Ferruginibacter sp. TaxID=1940288 RepID=UPI002659AA64|nr:response regulator [Ferruginibacter sp.]